MQTSYLIESDSHQTFGFISPGEGGQPDEGPGGELPELAELEGELLQSGEEAEVLGAEARLGEEQVRARQPHPQSGVQADVGL